MAVSSSSQLQSTRDSQIDAFLLSSAELLHRYGTPSFRLEGVMEKVARSLDVEGTFLYTPTALVVGLKTDSGERTYVRRVDSGDVDISKLLAIDAILERLEKGGLELGDASKELQAVADARPRFRLPVQMLASSIACAGVAVIIGGTAIDTLVSGLFGFVISYAAYLFQRFAQRGLLEPFLGFTVAVSAVMLAGWLPINDRLTTMAALILSIPGLSITIALTELAVGHLSAGSARLAGAMVTLLTLVVGVAIAWRVTADWRVPLAGGMEPLPWWCLWIAVALTPVAFAVVLRAPVSQWPAIVIVVIAGFAVSRWTTFNVGPEIGALCGALVVGCLSNAYARIWNRPAMIPQTPGLLILVPGAIGYRSLTAMIENDTLRGIELAFSMSVTGVVLVGGLLLANQLISPKRIL